MNCDENNKKEAGSSVGKNLQMKLSNKNYTPL
jgi:hypothetical protein